METNTAFNGRNCTVLGCFRLELGKNIRYNKDTRILYIMKQGESIMYMNHNPKQPDALEEILALRPANAETSAVPVDNLSARMKGALMGCFIGCTLEVPVENYPVL